MSIEATGSAAASQDVEQYDWITITHLPDRTELDVRTSKYRLLRRPATLFGIAVVLMILATSTASPDNPVLPFLLGLGGFLLAVFSGAILLGTLIATRLVKGGGKLTVSRDEIACNDRRFPRKSINRYGVDNPYDKSGPRWGTGGLFVTTSAGAYAGVTGTMMAAGAMRSGARKQSFSLIIETGGKRHTLVGSMTEEQSNFLFDRFADALTRTA